MTRTHFTIRQSGTRHVAFCRCHHPIGAWTTADLDHKIQEVKP